MIRSSLILILIFGSHLIIGQEDQKDFLIKETLYQDYSNLGFNIKSEYKVQYAYNAYGQIENTMHFTRKGVNAKWTKKHESSIRYDVLRREIYFSSKSYNGNTGELLDIYTLNRNYVDDYVAQYHSKYKHFESNREEIKITSFNSEGRLIYEFTSYTDNENREEWESSWEYNNNGCIVNSTFSVALYNNDQLIEDSKSKTEYNFTQDCEFLESKDFNFDENTDTYIHTKTTRIERKLDALGNLILREVYEKTEGSNTGFVKTQAEYHFYDDQNRDTLYIVEDVNYDIYSYRIHKSYSDDGKLVDTYLDVWNPEDSVWVVDWEQQILYDDNSNIIESFSRGNYNSSIDRFQTEREARYEYNGSGRITYSYSKETDFSKDPPWIIEKERRIDYNENGQEIYFYDKNYYSYSSFTRITEDSISYETACDDRMVKITRKSLKDNTGTVQIYTYFDIPDCELEDTPTSEYILFPNPAQDVLHIRYEGLPMESKFSIYDMNGKLMHNSLHQLRNLLSLDISHLLPGVYILNITIGEEQHLHKFTRIRQ